AEEVVEDAFELEELDERPSGFQQPAERRLVKCDVLVGQAAGHEPILWTRSSWTAGFFVPMPVRSPHPGVLRRAYVGWACPQTAPRRSLSAAVVSPASKRFSRCSRSHRAGSTSRCSRRSATSFTGNPRPV